LETLWADVPRVPFEPAPATPAAKTQIRQPTLDGFGAFQPKGPSPDDPDDRPAPAS
jgi:hypothetical protein